MNSTNAALQTAVAFVLSGLALVTGDPASHGAGEPEYEVTIIQPPKCPPFGFLPTQGYGINSPGDVVGFHRRCDLDDTADDAFVWTPESGLVDLPISEGFSEAQAFDINDRRQIVGRLRIEPDNGLYITVLSARGRAGSRSMRRNIQVEWHLTSSPVRLGSGLARRLLRRRRNVWIWVNVMDAMAWERNQR